MPRGGHNKGQRSFPLTAEQIRREYLDKDVSMQQAAEALGCTVKVLWQACKDHGLTAKSHTRGIEKGRPPVLTKLRDHAWLTAQMETRTFADIAKELGTRSNVVARYAREHALYAGYATQAEAIRAGMRKMEPVPHKAHQMSKEDIVREYLEKDVNMHQACRVLGCSPPTLIEAMTHYGLEPKDNERKIAIPGHHSPRWKGGRILMPNGYVAIRCADHPNADKAGNVMEHRLVAEEMLGRSLTPQEHVHHINRVRWDNRPENLQVLSKEEHRRLHRLEDARAVQDLEKQDAMIARLQQQLAEYEALHGPLPDAPLRHASAPGGPSATRRRRRDQVQPAVQLSLDGIRPAS